MHANEIPDQRYTMTWSGGRGTVKFLRRSDGSRLRYFTAGTGPPLVLLHTVRTQLDYFQRVVPALWDEYTVYALDLPGMGWSDIAGGARYGEPELRGALVEFITALDLRDVTLVGESMGGAIALLASIELTGHLSSVIAFNPYDYPSGLERGNWLARLIGTAVRLPGSGPIFARLENRLILKGMLAGGFADRGALPKDFVTELRRSGRRRGYPTVNRAIMRNLTGFIDARDRYTQVEAPVTLIYSEHDWSRVADREQVARRLPHADIITIPGTGHFSALERPTEMVRIIRRSATARR
ncbi:alpha/beta fold hydrolase [Mycobacterium sp. 852002-40037_SCH5390672]|uniref:alpha/beta fold hydrolase n=1 Tax=Mycobacterium sp. 852002-40037_SCH5390672 TaxID=1834089 RepID=UPI000805A9EF|nr:alpha/beta hydrolase [Mycobacterium sp. 852002-40037_SCH5390672]OBB95110.1 alpha/beta hydrolase [Mycobacterium sp. 852002-40037_SCH5390672]